MKNIPIPMFSLMRAARTNCNAHSCQLFRGKVSTALYIIQNCHGLKAQVI